MRHNHAPIPQASPPRSIKIVTVRDGFVGVTYDDGVLTVLQPGRHTLVKPSHTVCGFLSMGQQVLQLKQVRVDRGRR